jgi:hypothetical protein
MGRRTDARAWKISVPGKPVRIWRVKTCTKCHHELPVDWFGPQEGGKYGVKARCRSCSAQTERDRRRQRRESQFGKPGPGPLTRAREIIKREMAEAKADKESQDQQ